MPSAYCSSNDKIKSELQIKQTPSQWNSTVQHEFIVVADVIFLC